MFLKQKHIKPTHLKQLTSTLYCLAPWARIYLGKTVVTSEEPYSALYVTSVAITMFRTSHHQSVYCARSLQSAQYCTVHRRFVFVFSSHLCLGLQALLSDKLFPSKLSIHFFCLPRPIIEKNC